MTTHTIYATDVSSHNSHVQSYSETSFADMISGAGLNVDGTAGGSYESDDSSYWDGQVTFLEFDTSVIDDADTISSATLNINFGTITNDPGAFVFEARLDDFGAYPVTTADWESDWSTKTLLASLSTSGLGSGRSDLNSESAFLTNVDKTGDTRIVTVQDDVASGVDPSVTAEQGAYFFDGTATTATDPRLTVISSSGVPTLTYHYLRSMGS
jgi:hypothetical protein